MSGGAHCVISLVIDADDDETGQPACVVHAHWAPCPFDGAPASPSVLHADDIHGPEGALEFWRSRTDGQRPLVVHRGSLLGPGRPHEVEKEFRGCWCDPVLHTAD